MRIEWFFVIFFILVIVYGLSILSFNYFKAKGRQKILEFLYNGINSPIKRIGFVVFIFSLIIFLLAYLQLDRNASYIISDSIIFFRDSYNFNFYIWLGFYGSLIGLLLSFFYDKTFKKLILWILKK